MSLGLKDFASDTEVKLAWRKLARRYHPDAGDESAANTERFRQVSAAWEVLGNARARARYDAELRSRRAAAAAVPGLRFDRMGAGGVAMPVPQPPPPPAQEPEPVAEPEVPAAAGNPWLKAALLLLAAIILMVWVIWQVKTGHR